MTWTVKDITLLAVAFFCGGVSIGVGLLYLLEREFPASTTVPLVEVGYEVEDGVIQVEIDFPEGWGEAVCRCTPERKEGK